MLQYLLFTVYIEKTIQKLQKTARKLHFEQFFISFCYDIDKGKEMLIMKKLNPIIQFIIGFFSIMLLWGIGALVNTYTVDMWLDENIDTGNLILSCIVPMVVIILIPIMLLVFTVISKRKSLKIMYISALIATALPVLSSAFSMLFSNDGNILSWIYYFTIGLILYPFGRMAFEVYDGVDSFYWVYKDAFIEDSTIIGFLVVAIVVSIVLYRVIKVKTKCE